MLMPSHRIMGIPSFSNIILFLRGALIFRAISRSQKKRKNVHPPKFIFDVDPPTCSLLAARMNLKGSVDKSQDVLSS